MTRADQLDAVPLADDYAHHGLMVACNVSTPQFSIFRTHRPHNGAARLLQKAEGIAEVPISAYSLRK